MTEQQLRYDRIAAGYARWWAPVLAPTAVGALDRLDGLRAGTRLLDVGTGTATLSIAALRRWPGVEVVGIDASSGMAEAARAEADRLLSTAERARFRVEVSFADRLPFDDASFDGAVSSFVLQLVPSRSAVLREVRRVLRPGARFAHVTWLVGDREFEPDVAFDAALEDIGVGAREPEGRRGDYRSVRTAMTDLRRAGFSDVVAEESELVHIFGTDGYVGFLEEFDEEDLFSSLEPDVRDKLRRGLRRRLARLPAAAFELRLPVVTAHGDVP